MVYTAFRAVPHRQSSRQAEKKKVLPWEKGKSDGKLGMLCVRLHCVWFGYWIFWKERKLENGKLFTNHQNQCKNRKKKLVCNFVKIFMFYFVLTSEQFTPFDTFHSTKTEKNTRTQRSKTRQQSENTEVTNVSYSRRLCKPWFEKDNMILSGNDTENIWFSICFLS